MDPQENLMEQLRIAQDIQQFNDESEDGPEWDTDDLIRNSEQLAGLVIALNDWILNGGFLPQDWR